MQAYLSLVAGALLSYNVVLPSVWIVFFLFSFNPSSTSAHRSLSNSRTYLHAHHRNHNDDNGPNNPSSSIARRHLSRGDWACAAVEAREMTTMVACRAYVVL